MKNDLIKDPKHFLYFHNMIYAFENKLLTLRPSSDSFPLTATAAGTEMHREKGEQQTTQGSFKEHQSCVFPLITLHSSAAWGLFFTRHLRDKRVRIIHQFSCSSCRDRLSVTSLSLDRAVQQDFNRYTGPGLQELKQPEAKARQHHTAAKLCSNAYTADVTQEASRRHVSMRELSPTHEIKASVLWRK